MSNQYFNFYKNNQEFNLYNNMALESIEIFGIDCLYMPRSVRKTDMLFGEDSGAYFTNETSFEIKMYLEDTLSFGEDEMYSKFGLTVNNRCTLFVQQDRIRNLIGDEPFFGDLIYIPMFNRLFEVTNPEEKNTHFLFGRLMTYAIKCELIKYSQEKIDVGIDEIDNLYGNTAPTVSLTDNFEDTNEEVVDFINFDEESPI